VFESYGRVFRENEELFNDTSWFAVMVGQGWFPRATTRWSTSWASTNCARMADIKAVIAKSAEVMPGHFEFIKANCDAMA
jgi:tryptophan halogenase